MIDLAEQVILITGASSGIGAALAEQLALKFPGIRLVLAARNQEKLAQVAERCQKAGAEVLVVPTDLTNPEQVKALPEKTLEQFGQIDVLVNNAGYGQMGAVELIPTPAVQRQFQVNLLGPLALIQALIPILRDRGGGRIVNVSSLGGRIAFPFGGLYSASKFALEGLSDALRRELDPFKIKIIVVEPGPVSTGFFEVAATEVTQTVAHPEETPYRAAYAKLEKLQQQTSGNAWTSEQVAEVIIKALRAKNPRPRYVAATGGEFLIFMMTKLLPTRWVDLFWQYFYGINQVAQEWQQQLPQQTTKPE